MATGKFEDWKGTFGFIKNDAGGQNVFAHVNENPDLQGKESALIQGSAVTFEIRDSIKKPGKTEAYNVRLQGPSSLAKEATKPESSTGETPDRSFHNPYTFVPSPPRQDAINRGGFASDFDPLEHHLNHASLQPKSWTGHLPIKLTVVTPLVLPAAGCEDRSSATHQTYDMLDRLPESSLRGMLRSAYETVTNSRYGCFKNDDRLAYRMDTGEALKLIPAIIEYSSSGNLQARLYPGTSMATKNGPTNDLSKPDEKRAVYAAMLTRYHPALNSGCSGSYTPRTGDEVWAEIVLCQHEVSPRGTTSWRKDHNYTFWKVIEIWPTSGYPTQPTPTGKSIWHSGKPKTKEDSRQSYYAPLDPKNPQRKVVKGRVLITNENMGNKHDERIFIGAASVHPVSDDVKKAWGMRIKSYREAHAENDIFGRKGASAPWDKIGSTPGKTAWSPHLYQDGKHQDQWGREAHDAQELQPGDMVYARCKFDEKGTITGIEDLFPVMISRELYETSPDGLLDASLKPAAKMIELSPADRLFGWAPHGQGDDGGYKGRIRVVCEDGARPEIIIEKFDGTLPLAILGQPKPAQGRFYVSKDVQGNPQDDDIDKKQAGYSDGKSLRGRKQYWHHKGLEAKQAADYWKPSVEDRTQQLRNGRYQEYRRPNGADDNPQIDSQNRSITGWIKPDTLFLATLYVQNLQSEEVGALLWLLSLPEGHFFRLGYGKPLGFGSVRLEIDTDRCVNGCLPLGTGEDWKAYYADFSASPPATLGKDRQKGCLQTFKTSMAAAYSRSPADSETAEKSREQSKPSSDRRLNSFAALKDVSISAPPEDQQRTDEERFNDLPFIQGFVQVLSGPQKDAPIHYPREGAKPNPQGENFKWFVANERRHARKLALPAVTDAKGLPYQP